LKRFLETRQSTPTHHKALSFAINPLGSMRCRHGGTAFTVAYVKRHVHLAVVAPYIPNGTFSFVRFAKLLVLSSRFYLKVCISTLSGPLAIPDVKETDRSKLSAGFLMRSMVFTSGMNVTDRDHNFV